MLAEKRKRYIFASLMLIILCAGVAFGLILFQRNQDIRQQASTSCNPGDPYCVCNSSGVCEIVSEDSARKAVVSEGNLSNKGIVATNFTGERATTQSSCSGLWMNDFCYMEGDELAGGYVVVNSGDGKNYPHMVKEEIYDSAQYGSSTIDETLGSQDSLGDNCGGKGMAVNGICYAYGSSINGYLVMPPRSGDCDNSTGDYCYAHLEKIEVSYSDWNSAVSAYENNGNIKALEDLYQKTYGISLDSSNLYDS